jgi:TIR domain
VRKRKGERRRRSRGSVFISHFSRDAWIAAQIALHLQQCGARTFLYEVDVESGEDFEVRIFAALRSCSELLVLITPQSIDRKYVWAEIGAAEVQRKRVTAIIHPWTFDELIEERKELPVLIRRTRARNINDMGAFFAEFGRRA